MRSGKVSLRVGNKLSRSAQVTEKRVMSLWKCLLVGTNHVYIKK